MQERDSYVKELESLVAEFEAVMAQRDESQQRVAALERDLSHSSTQQQQLEASLEHAQQVDLPTLSCTVL